MIDKNIQHMVRVEAAAAKPKIDADMLFTSPEFDEHLHNLIAVVTGKYKIPVKLKLFHDAADPTTAFTDGRSIVQNTHNELVYTFENLYNRYMACVGMTMHEVSHVLFCNFAEDKKAIEAIKQGVLYGDSPDTQTQEEADALDEMLDALKMPEFRPVFETVYSEISNCIADPHDEDKLNEKFGGFVENTVLMCREALRMSIDPLEDMMDDDKCSKLSTIYSVVLQFVRFGEIVVNEPDNMFKLEPIQKLMQMSVALDQARYTDDPLVKAEQINKILLYLWPYIKEEVEKQEKAQQQQSNQSQNGQQSSGGGGDPAGGAQQPQPQQAPSQQTVQSILNQIQQGSQNSGQTQAPKRGKTSAAAKANARAAKKGKQAPAANKTTTSSAQNGQGEQMLATLLDAIAQAMAEETVQQDISNAVGAEIATVDQNSTHRGRVVQVVPQTSVTDADKKLYNELMKDLIGYSKRLQKQMMFVLRDLQDGSIAHHRAFGNRIEANAAYRPDQRYYAKKKLPQDLPEMAISILVDHSGSMAGERLLASMKAAMLLYDFATNLDIPVCVSGHNTTTGGIHYYTYTDFKKVSDGEKYRLAKMVSGSCNRDGMALEIAANRLAKRPEDVKLLIIISDGQPNDTGYGGESAAEDIKDIVQKYRKRGVETIAAAIGTDKDRIKAIYGEGSFLDIDDLDKFPKKLVGLVKKRLIA